MAWVTVVGSFRRLIEKSTKHPEAITSLLSGAAVAFLMNVIALILGLLINITLGRYFGASITGTYYLVLGATMAAVTVSRFGIDLAAMRHLAPAWATGNNAVVDHIIRRSLVLNIATSAMVTCLVLAFSPLIAKFFFGKPDLVGHIRLMAMAIIPVTFLFLIGQLLRAMKAIRDSQLVNFVLTPFVGCILLSSVIWAGIQPSANLAILFYVTGAFSAFAVGSILLYKRRRYIPESDAGQSGAISISLLRPGSQLLWLGIMEYLFSWAAILIVGWYETEANVAVFAVAMRTAVMVGFIVRCVGVVVVPQFSTFYSRGDLKGLGQRARFGTRVSVVMTIPVAAVFWIFPSEVMSIFGSDFQAGSELLIILVVGQVINVVTGMVGFLLIMTGHEIQARNTNIVSLASLLFLSIILTPKYGAMGAAVAVAVSVSVKNIAAFILVKKYLRISPV
jgi:O-antigen/teichoic acid export membrane protein